MKYTKKQILLVFKESFSKSDVCRRLDWPINGTYMRKVQKLVEEYNLDISHFDGGAQNQRKYKLIEKTCPVCEKKFNTGEGDPKEKTVCSHSCSNTYFRSGENNPNYIHGKKRGLYNTYSVEYRYVCFSAYPHKCALCSWNKVVDVHHIDNNHKNNNIENLIPLCPNHHVLTRCNKYKDEINAKIQEFKNR